MAHPEPDDIARRLASRLKMRHLTLLLQIQKQGSLTRVAQHMATSQPAVTHALAELEAMFGTPLFERSARGMAATAQGEVVLARARAMLHDLDLLTLDMEAVASGRAAHLHIGAIPFISGQLLSAAIQGTLPGEQRLTVTIHDGTSEQLLAMLRDHALDFVIGRASAALDMAGITHEILYRQHPRLIASRGLAGRLGRRRLEWDKLADLDWILGPRRTSMREQVSDIFLRAGLNPPAPIVESYSSKLIGEMIAANERAVSIVPADVAEELARTAGVAIVPYSFDWTLPPIALFARADARPRPIDSRFAATLRGLCAQASAQAGGDPYQY
ncbi:LysR substrate-binding domain-containing protein [Pollutimonas bauzanensis]|uniref:Transcriptional regulator, LysR family n=1 Tax=Pollutimonas bauzanensis TaxID=658167 RepID=A0A1M5MC73_9BURK|nr:LysR substrate-binding domain-containing protein [Pollutimonas bauzanensis]SHG74866.1 transcriptional regulator, LysR family [Pollutimonas bauzanensis]